MKSFIVVCLFGLAALAVARYTDKYDNINVDEILDNPRILESYSNCVLDKGKCSPEGKELKDHVQEALENNCGDCTEFQATSIRRVIKHYINKVPAVWSELRAKYDPKGTYAVKYEKELRELTAS